MGEAFGRDATAAAPLVEALNAGAIDTGLVGDAPFTFGAAGAPVDSWASMIRFTVLWVVPQIAAAPR